MELGSQQQATNPEVQERTEGLKNSLKKEEDIPAVSETAGTERVQETESENAFQNALPTFLVMMTMLGLVWLWSRKKGKASASGEKSRELGEHVLGQGAQLKFVEVNNEVWVIGLTAGSLNLLHRVPKSEWLENSVGELTEMKSDVSDFKSLYKMFRN
jgi:flagellar biogenesis protein FliO